MKNFKKTLDNQQKIKKTYLYRLRIGNWRLYLSNARLKKMNPSHARRYLFYTESLSSVKRRRYKQNGGTCDICGRRMKYEDVQMHHVLPFAEFPQYGLNPTNLEIACCECHHAIHMNPYENLRRMEQKARELGFDLKVYFDGNRR